MAFTGNYLADVFKTGLLTANFNFSPGSGSIFKCALYDNTVSFNNSVVTYSTDGEVISGGDYVSGGFILTPIIGTNNGIAYVSFSSVVLNNVAFSYSYGALIYNSSFGNYAVCVLDFGGARYTASNGQFTLNMPAATNTTALIRI